MNKLNYTTRTSLGVLSPTTKNNKDSSAINRSHTSEKMACIPSKRLYACTESKRSHTLVSSLDDLIPLYPV